MGDALIIDAVRTPFGRYGGAIAALRPDDLAARVVEASVARTGADPASVDEVVLGATNQAGEDNRNVARMAGLIARLPVEVPGVTVNRLCASSLEAVIQAARAVRLGDSSLVLAGGVESMSRAPLVGLKPEQGFPRGGLDLVDTTIGWRFVNPRMTHSTESMGETAENVAERYDVSRADQDAFAAESHRRAVDAAQARRFADELIAVEVPQHKGDPIVVEADEGPRPDSTPERLAKLRAIFREGGSVTAGNASPLNDGASCVTIASPERAEELRREPLARVVASAAVGVDPAVMGIGPVPAVRAALERAGLRIGEIDLVELNEAFASQALACARELRIPPERLNVNGGAIALGHPLGASGARLAGTLAWELRRRGARYGVATMCVGVGQGVAVVIENATA